MFERFTERARQVVVLAQESAKENRVGYIGPEHILVGLMIENEGLAARVLTHLGVTLDTLVEHVADCSKGELAVLETGQIPFTPRAKACLELALREALSLGHNYIGTEHILLGLLREGYNKSVDILEAHYDLDQESIRNEVLRMLSGPKAPILGKQKKATEQEVDSQEAKLQVVKSKLEELKKTQELRDLLTIAITLGRQFPDRPAQSIANAAIALHDPSNAM
jgi:ATP-dependent Clp protease ATP-binding subunit ClpA